MSIFSIWWKQSRKNRRKSGRSWGEEGGRSFSDKSQPKPLQSRSLRENPNDPTKHTTTIFSEFSLEGRTAVISGGNGGLGLEIALAYVEAGAHVYAIDLPKEPSEEFKIVAEHCRIMDRQLQYISCTVTDDEDMNRVMEHIRNDSGSLDICVAAAGILQTYQALDYPVKEFQKVIV